MKLKIGDKVMVQSRNDDPWWDLVVPAAPDGLVEVTVIGERWTHDVWNVEVVELQSDFVQQTVPISAIQTVKKPFRLKDGKKYETADGQVFKVRDNDDGYFDENDVNALVWRPDGSGVGNVSLIRRHYTKPQPAHKLDLNKGDVVELMGWEDGASLGVGETFKVGKKGIQEDDRDFNQPKGERPLFKVVSRRAQPS